MMLMRAPKFWYSSSNNVFSELVLYPLSKIYSFFAALNYKAKYNYKDSELKIIAVGGITIGGSGKTPTVIALSEMLSNIKKRSVVLTRGFGRISSEVLKVDNKKHVFQQVGDESLLISRYVDVFVGTDRAKCARMAKKLGHDLMILDDGLTQKYIQPDVKLVVIDNQQGFGNGYMLPLGPNRLSFNIIKGDIDAVIIIKTFQYENAEKIKSEIPESIPIIFAYPKYDFAQVKPGERCLVFCGLGYPEKFFRILDDKMHIVKRVEFPDHHSYTDDEITDLLDEANLYKVKLVTTEKDIMRIPKRYHDFISTVPMKIIFNDTAKLFSILGIKK